MVFFPGEAEARCAVCGEPSSAKRGPVGRVLVEVIHPDGFFSGEKQALLVGPGDSLWARIIAVRKNMHPTCQPTRIESVVLK